MLSKEMIKKGIEEGIIRFIVDPNMEHGTVCEIGAYWFYFGGLTAEEENPDEFLQSANIDDIVNDIYDALEDIHKDTPSEYLYYLCYLTENLKDVEGPKMLIVVNFIDLEDLPELSVGIGLMLHSRRYLFYGTKEDTDTLSDSIDSALESVQIDMTADDIVDMAFAESGHKWTNLNEDDAIPACEGCYVINV